MTAARLPILAVLALTAGLLLCAAPAAEAYRFTPAGWPYRVIPYSSSATKYRAQVKAAARTWNASGARVRWVATTPRRSLVHIRVDRRLRVAGRTTLVVFGPLARARIDLRADLRENARSAAQARSIVTQVLVHEMGHVMGLDHEDRRCTVMNTYLLFRCRRPAEPWRYRCRLLETDDVRGAVRRFGGRVRRVGPEFCNAVAQPPAPAGVTVAPETPTGGAPRVTWRTPASGRVLSLRVLRRPGACPARPTTSFAGGTVVATPSPRRGRTQSVTDSTLREPGRYCYAVIAVGKLRRPSRAATAVYENRSAPAPAAAAGARLRPEPPLPPEPAPLPLLGDLSVGGGS